MQGLILSNKHTLRELAETGKNVLVSRPKFFQLGEDVWNVTPASRCDFHVLVKGLSFENWLWCVEEEVVEGEVFVDVVNGNGARGDARPRFLRSNLGQVLLPPRLQQKRQNP